MRFVFFCLILFFVAITSCGNSENEEKNECSFDSDCPAANSYCTLSKKCEIRPKCENSSCPDNLSECWSDNYCYKDKEQLENDSVEKEDNSAPVYDDFDRIKPGTTTEG